MKGDGKGIGVGEVEPTIKVINTIWNFHKPAWNVREFYFGGLLEALAVDFYHYMNVPLNVCVHWQTKKDVDPDKPKRPQSAFFLWLNENRPRIKEEFPGISVTELTKKAGEMWKELTDKSVSIA